MRNRCHTILGLSLLYLALAALPAQAAETRAQSFSILCDGALKSVPFTMTGLGASVARFIQGASFAITDPRGGVKYMRLQAASDNKKILLDMGAATTTARSDLTSSLVRVDTNAAGTVAMQVIGACIGPGTLQGWTTIWLFS